MILHGLLFAENGDEMAFCFYFLAGVLLVVGFFLGGSLFLLQKSRDTLYTKSVSQQQTTLNHNKIALFKKKQQNKPTRKKRKKSKKLRAECKN